jgi:RHS repeat-associated protein
MTRGLSLALALAFLSPGIVSGADVVQFYHLDAIGNVRVVTNATGAVVERHDYLPLGEECTTGVCASNPGITASQPRHFTGKERDTETGLDYFGARYYRGNLGRFTTVDPMIKMKDALVDPQRWNRYAYGLNNPFRYIDPDGRWPSTFWLPVHQQSIDRALPGVSASRREGLKVAVEEADSAEFQTSQMAFRHGMRGPGETEGRARSEANAFIRSEIEQAQNYEKMGADADAMAHLGLAMHALQDATSPAHEGFQEWRTEWNSYASLHAEIHGSKERKPDAEQRGRLDRATRDSWDYFTGKKEMPADFFGDRK